MWTRVLMAANSANVALASFRAKTIVNRRGNVTNEFYAQFHFMQRRRPGEPFKELYECSLCLSVCLCVSCHIYCLELAPAGWLAGWLVGRLAAHLQ